MSTKKVILSFLYSGTTVEKSNSKFKFKHYNGLFYYFKSGQRRYEQGFFNEIVYFKDEIGCYCVYTTDGYTYGDVRIFKEKKEATKFWRQLGE